ncbi:hypothetical protein AcV5_008764 [Taiwanofungus camphoratus]|nr:hypothetical protein AcV5_008764 [Antrodia cinnamomea]
MMFNHQSLLYLVLILPCLSSGRPVLAPSTAISAAESFSEITSGPPSSAGADNLAVSPNSAEAPIIWIITTEAVISIPKPSGSSPGSTSSINDLDVVPSLTSTNTGLPSNGALSPTPVASTPSPTTLYLPPSSEITESPLQGSRSSSASSSTTSTYTQVPVRTPTGTDIIDPNPTSEAQSASNAASQQARHSAIIAAFLTMATLSSLGMCILCMRCKLASRLRRLRRRSRKVRFADQAAEEGRKVFPTLREKQDKYSAASGLPALQGVTLPVLVHGQQPSTGSTSPATSRPSPVTDWRVFASNVDGQFEDVTHILSTNVFAPLERDARSRSPDSGSSGAGSGEAGSTSRTSGGAASMTGDSYTTCESRYSSPSIEHHDTQDDLNLETDLPESMSLSFSFRSPSPPVSVLQTPELYGYPAATGAGAFDAGAQETGKGPHAPLLGPAIPGPEGMNVESEWDVAQAYGASASGRKEPTPNVIIDNMEMVEVGGRKCVLVQG